MKISSTSIMNALLWIGLYPGMGEEKLDYMVEMIRGLFGGSRHGAAS